MKRWEILPCDREAAAKNAAALGIPALSAALLQSRGASTPEEIRALLTGDTLSDPFLMLDMDRAVNTIQAAIDAGKRICVYGDYDADGVTATSMLLSYLESCGADACFYIPEREGEGYGMNVAAVEKLSAEGVELLVTVDNGIASVLEAQRAAELGMELVITDHHQPQGTLPEAAAVVDPHREGDKSPCKMLCGAGVVLKLILALEGEYADLGAVLEEYAELAALGTIGDVVPLTGENRVLVREGLRLLPRTDRPGLRALMEHAGVSDKELSATTVAFSLVPRLNATGRMGSPDRAVRLLTGEDPGEAEALALEICADNDSRRATEDEIVAEALALFEKEPDRLYDRILVAEGENWHHGVVGIVASRLTDRFGKPSIVLSVNGEEARGSGRSVEGFSLFGAVSSCADLLTRYGGHPMAAGLSLETRRLKAFRARVNGYAAALGSPMPVPVLSLDGLLKPAKIGLEIPRAVAVLEPFGTGNPAPLFGVYGMKLTGLQPVGNGKHLRVQVEKDGVSLTCMRFGVSLEAFPYPIGTLLDLAVTVESKPFRGQDTLSVYIRDLKRSDCPVEELIQGRALYEKGMRGEALTTEEAGALLPTREEAALLYRALRAAAGYRGGEEGLAALAPLPVEKLLTLLRVFGDRGLASVSECGDLFEVALLEAPGKVDLLDCERVRYLQGFLPERTVTAHGVSH